MSNVLRPSPNSIQKKKLCLTEAEKKYKIKIYKLKNYAETYFSVLLFNIEQLKFHEKSGIHTLRTHVKKRKRR